MLFIFFFRCSATTEDVAIGLLPATSTSSTYCVSFMAATFAHLCYAAPSRSSKIGCRFQMFTPVSRDWLLVLTLRDVLPQANGTFQVSLTPIAKLHQSFRFTYLRSIPLHPCRNSGWFTTAWGGTSRFTAARASSVQILGKQSEEEVLVDFSVLDRSWR